MSNINSFEKYCSKVFKLGGFLSSLEDNRKEPDVDIEDIVKGVFLGSALRVKAISTIEEEIREGMLRKRVLADISDDTIGYGLDHLEPESIQQGWYGLVKLAKRNGMLRDNPFKDYIVGVFDGIETYSSYWRKCDNCLSRKIERKLPGKKGKGKKETAGKKETIEMTQYYHRAVVLTLVGYDFPIPVGLEMVKKGEDEVTCALRLLERVVKNLGVRFLDIVIGDALYCTPNFFKECKNLGILAGAVLKDNQKNLLETAKVQTRITKPVIEEGTTREKLKLWDLPKVVWDTADTDVRVIWAERLVWGKNQINQDKQKPSCHWAKKRNVFAFSKEIHHLPAHVLYCIGRHRWDIDSNIFMDMTQNWHLKHKTLHFDNAYQNILSIRFIAYMIFMFFFHRHINSRRKDKIQAPAKMVRMLYRSACENIEPMIISLE